ncbi:hypothetical protein [Streptomyces atroolivaceus]|uniref:hypothetical protein n=1 Tax=Streptomyces atroolivaceus TaxID=66869 RepID=UPI0020253ECD|nr:hypothetical protein [Streptomyces atroolivaceus]
MQPITGHHGGIILTESKGTPYGRAAEADAAARSTKTCQDKNDRHVEAEAGVRVSLRVLAGARGHDRCSAALPCGFRREPFLRVSVQFHN